MGAAKLMCYSGSTRYNRLCLQIAPILLFTCGTKSTRHYYIITRGQVLFINFSSKFGKWPALLIATLNVEKYQQFISLIKGKTTKDREPLRATKVPFHRQKEKWSKCSIPVHCSLVPGTMPAGYKRRRPPSTNLIERVTSSTTGMLVLLGLAGWSNAQPESTTTTSSNDNVSRFMPDDETTLLGANDTTATSETEIFLPPPNIRSVSGAFSASLGGVLIVMVLFRIFVLFLLCRHRKESALQLAQSSVLSVFVVVGTIALGSCYLVLPLHDVTCLLRDPLIFTPLTVSCNYRNGFVLLLLTPPPPLFCQICGNILLGRIWRIIVLMTPVLKERRQRGVLSALSHIAYSNECTKFNQASLRRKVTLGRLLYMVCLLSVPQVLFQVCHVLVPSMRGSLTITESSDPWHVPKYECETGHGYWTTWISVSYIYLLNALYGD